MVWWHFRNWDPLWNCYKLHQLIFIAGVNRIGNENFNGQRYWMSWKSDDPQLRGAVWDWFNARNYCRKRCMDLVSIETREEYEFLKSHMGGK